LALALEAKREPFAGLWLDKSDYQWLPKPVLRLNFENMAAPDPKALEAQLVSALGEAAQALDLPASGDRPAAAFGEMVDKLAGRGQSGGLGEPAAEVAGKLSAEAVGKIEGQAIGQATGQAIGQGTGEVAVIVEGYDAPVLKAISEPALAAQVWKVLEDLYRAMRQSDKVGLLLFVGETALGFTEGPGLRPVGDAGRLGALGKAFGFSWEELNGIFGEWVEYAANSGAKGESAFKSLFAEDPYRQLMDHYGGYSWNGRDRVINPESLFAFFGDPSFKDHWVEGAFGELKARLNGRSPEALDYLGKALKLSEVSPLRPEAPSAASLMYFRGFLTVDKSADKPVDKSVDKSADKPTDKPVDKSTDKFVDKSVDKSTDKSADKPTDTIGGADPAGDSFLAFPNDGVKGALLPLLLEVIPPKTDAREAYALAASFTQALIDHDRDRIEDVFRDLLWLAAPPRGAGINGFDYCRRLTVYALAMANQGLWAFDADQFDYLMERRPIPGEADFEPRFFALRFRDATDRREAIEAEAENFKKTPIQAIIRSKLPPESAANAMNVSGCRFLFRDASDGLKAAVYRL
jgi:hypothetical protein